MLFKGIKVMKDKERLRNTKKIRGDERAIKTQAMWALGEEQGGKANENQMKPWLS